MARLTTTIWTGASVLRRFAGERSAGHLSRLCFSAFSPA